MLYLDYSRKEGEWIPNEFGGRENLEAISLLKELNEATHRECPGALMIAEESTAWPQVSHPVYAGGLGFDFKWNMGWMHDTLKYFQTDPLFRGGNHNALTFGLLYAWSENFILPFSHDEVVHGKRSMFGRIPGDDWQKAATLRALYGFMYAHPGKKLMFMGGEFGQEHEWNHDQSLDWQLLDQPKHRGIQTLVRDLNVLYRKLPALHELDCEPAGFRWLDANDAERSLLVFERAAQGEQRIICALNLTPVPRFNVRAGVERAGLWSEILNTDAGELGGSGHGNLGGVEAVPVAAHGRPFSLSLTVPPLGAVWLRK